MNYKEKQLLEEHQQDAERFKNFLILCFCIGAALGTVATLIYINY